MSPYENDEIGESANFWEGVKRALCCIRSQAQSPTSTVSSSEVVLPKIKILPRANSFTNLRWSRGFRKACLNDKASLSLNDINTPKVVRATGLAAWRGRSASRSSQITSSHSANSNKETLDIGPSSVSIGMRSIWDSFFESHSTMLWTKHTENIFANNDGLGGDCSDWEKDTNISILELTPENESVYKDSLVSSEYSKEKGEVLLSFNSKGGMRSTYFPLDTRLELVAKWLSKGSPKKIPIWGSSLPRTRDKKGPIRFHKQTLSELFEGGLDPKKDGIICFIGPVEGRISFKMSLCKREILQKATRHNGASNSVIQMSQSKLDS